MAIAAKLFYSSNPEDETLHRRIVPSSDHQELQRERWNEVCDFLIEDLGVESGYSISSWLQGSYKFGTQIMPPRNGEEFDIDLGIYFNWAGKPEDGIYTPQEMKSLVQTSLEKYSADTEDVLEVVSPAKTRCSRIRFKGDFHIDVPSYHLDPERDSRSLATEENKWEKSDPKAIYKWFRDQFSEDESNLVRRLIRYMKMWAALHFKLEKRPSTIMLTVLMSDAFLSLTPEQQESDDEAFHYSIGNIISRLNDGSAVDNPVDPSENLNRLSSEDYTDFMIKLDSLLNISASALKANTELEAALIWDGVFSHFFPIPKTAQDTATSKALVPVKFIPEVSVKGVSNTNSSIPPYSGKNKITLSKRCLITFTLDNSQQLPPGAQVSWVVRNEGQEAEFTNDLGHRSGTGPIGTEHSAYAGTHFMDVTVKSVYGEIIGFRRIPVEVLGVFIPARNPKKKRTISK